MESAPEQTIIDFYSGSTHFSLYYRGSAPYGGITEYRFWQTFYSPSTSTLYGRNVGIRQSGSTVLATYNAGSASLYAPISNYVSYTTGLLGDRSIGGASYTFTSTIKFNSSTFFNGSTVFSSFAAFNSNARFSSSVNFVNGEIYGGASTFGDAYLYSLPSKSGTIALLDDIPSDDYVVANLEEIQDEGEDNEKTVTSNVVHEQAGTITLHQTVDYTNPGEGQENSETTLTVTDNIALAAQKGKYWQVENPDYDPEDPDSPEYIDGEGTQCCNISIRADGISFARYDENESGYSSDEVDIFGLNDDFNSFKEKSESFDEDTDHPYTIESKIEHNQTDSINLQVSRSYDESQEDYYNRYASAAVYNEEEAHLEAGKDIFWQAENPDYDPEDPDSPEYNTEQGWEAYQVKVTPDGVTFEHFGNNEDGDFDESVDLFSLASEVSGLSSVYASVSYVDSSISALSSVYAPVGSYISQADLSGYAQLSASNTFTGPNTLSDTQFTSTVGFYADIYLASSLAFQVHSESDQTHYAITLPYASGVVALTSDIPSSLPANGGTASAVSGYASEVWTFIVDDGQGGSSTVTKTILVG